MGNIQFPHMDPNENNNNSVERISMTAYFPERSILTTGGCALPASEMSLTENFCLN